MILVGVVLFTMTMPEQASPRESLVTVKYWRDYASSLFCECNRFWQRSGDQAGYRAMNTDELTESADDDELDDHDRIDNTECTEAE